MHLQRFVFAVFVVGVTSTDFNSNKSCVTPNGENATCVAFSDCAVIIAAVAAFTPEALKFGQDSKCGSDPGMVCCGSLGIPDKSRTLKPISFPQKQKIMLDRFSDPTTCGIVASSNRIKGGTAAQPEEFPWLAALEYKSIYTNISVGIRCGASIISQRYLLTAAHCIFHIEFEVVRGWLGVTNITSDQNCLNLGGKIECTNSIQKVNIKNRIIHPFYSSLHKHHDIGVLELEERIKFTKYVRSICLPKRRSSPPEIGTLMMVAGWGVTENREKPSDIKLKVELPLVNNTICNKLLEIDEMLVDSEQLCAGGEPGRDACQGDSGGPLMRDFLNENNEVQWYQVGLVSYGVGCGVNGHPGVYIKISRYVSWIVGKIYAVRQNLDEGDPCITFNGNLKTCVPLTMCHDIFNAVNAKNASDSDLVSHSPCGYANETLVCCESPGSKIIPNYNTKGLPDISVCGVVKIDSQSNITRGATSLGEFPWIVGLEYKSIETGEQHYIGCVGSLISNRYVLTAGDCLIRTYYKPVTAVLGDWQKSTDPDCEGLENYTKCAGPVKKIQVEKIIPHPFNSDSYLYQDVGLILLKDKVQFNDYISPICLPLPYFPPPEPGSPMTVTGWSKTENGKLYDNSDILQKIEVTLFSKDKCVEILEHYAEGMSANHICAEAENNNDSCISNVGAPLMRIYEDKSNGSIHWYQVGLLGDSACRRYPAAYTHIAKSLDWIISTITED